MEKGRKVLVDGKKKKDRMDGKERRNRLMDGKEERI